MSLGLTSLAAVLGTGVSNSQTGGSSAAAGVDGLESALAKAVGDGETMEGSLREGEADDNNYGISLLEFPPLGGDRCG